MNKCLRIVWQSVWVQNQQFDGMSKWIINFTCSNRKKIHWISLEECLHYSTKVCVFEKWRNYSSLYLRYPFETSCDNNNNADHSWCRCRQQRLSHKQHKSKWWTITIDRVRKWWFELKKKMKKKNYVQIIVFELIIHSSIIVIFFEIQLYHIYEISYSVNRVAKNERVRQKSTQIQFDWVSVVWSVFDF